MGSKHLVASLAVFFVCVRLEPFLGAAHSTGAWRARSLGPALVSLQKDLFEAINLMSQGACSVEQANNNTTTTTSALLLSVQWLWLREDNLGLLTNGIRSIADWQSSMLVGWSTSTVLPPRPDLGFVAEFSVGLPMRASRPSTPMKKTLGQVKSSPKVDTSSGRQARAFPGGDGCDGLPMLSVTSEFGSPLPLRAAALKQSHEAFFGSCPHRWIHCSLALGWHKTSRQMLVLMDQAKPASSRQLPRLPVSFASSRASPSVSGAARRLLQKLTS